MQKSLHILCRESLASLGEFILNLSRIPFEKVKFLLFFKWGNFKNNLVVKIPQTKQGLLNSSINTFVLLLSNCNIQFWEICWFRLLYPIGSHMSSNSMYSALLSKTIPIHSTVPILLYCSHNFSVFSLEFIWQISKIWVVIEKMKAKNTWFWIVFTNKKCKILKCTCP